jgi:hypothetical protein
MDSSAEIIVDLLNNVEATYEAGSVIETVSGGVSGTGEHDKLIHRDYINQHPISAITGLSTALAAKADADDIIVYELQPATSQTLGGIKVGNNLTIDEDGTLSAQAGGITAVKADWAQTNADADDFIKNKPTIPSQLSQLTSDSTHRTVADSEKTAWNNKADSNSVYNKTEIDGIVTGLTTDSELIAHDSSGSAHSAIRQLITNEVTRAQAAENTLSTNKVDKVLNKGLSTNDLTDALKHQYDDTVTKAHTHANNTVLDDISAAFTSELKTKLDGIETGANKYVLTQATTTSLGGVIVGTNLTIDDNGVLNATGGGGISQVQADWEQIDIESVDFIKNKPAIPVVDVTKEYTDTQLALKVDKEADKSLTSNDLTDVLKTNYDAAYTNMHTHTNQTALNNTSGINTGDETATSIKSKLGYTPESTSNKGIADGYCGLDSGSKVPLQNLPSTLLKYVGVWDASTNVPTLTNPDLTKISNVYTVSVAGTQFGNTWNLGDWLIYNASGNVEKSDNSDDVTSVNGQTGAVVIDVPTIDNITITEDSEQSLSAIGLIEKNKGTVKYDWVGTEAEYNTALSNGGIESNWICFITDDYTAITTADVAPTTDRRYVTDAEKALWGGKQDLLTFTPENAANKLTQFQTTPDNIHYPSEKLVSDSLSLKVNMADLADVAISGSYSDLSGTPTIESVTYETLDTKGDIGTVAGTLCAGNDSRLSDNRTDSNAIHKNVTNEFSSLTEKATLAGTDKLLIEDSAASGAKKYVQVSNLPTGSGGEGTTYTPGTGIEITAENVINVMLDPDTVVTTDNKLSVVGTLDKNNGSAVYNWVGTKAEYDTLTTKNDNWIYYVTDDTIEGTLTTAYIDDSTDRRYVTDTQLASLAGISGTNTGDETETTIINKLGYTPEPVASVVTYTASGVSSGINVADNQKITISEAVSALTILSSAGMGTIRLVTSGSFSITIPATDGWSGSTAPVLGSGLIYTIVYDRGTWYADNGR